MTSLRLGISLSLLTAALLVSEITLTRLFSVTMMYHFAFMVLSLALFGLGAGGLLHYLVAWFRRRAGSSLVWLPLAAAVAFPACLGLVLRLSFSPLVFNLRNASILALVIFLCIIPFFFCGLFVSLLYLSYPAEISRLYAFDLAGAAAGSIAAIPVLEHLGAVGGPWLVATLLALCSLVVSKSAGWFRLGISALCLVLFGLGWHAGWLQLRYIKGHREDPVEFEKWNAFSRVTVRNWRDRKSIQIDSDAATDILSADWIASNGRGLLDELGGMVYHLRKNGKALVVGAGGGRDLVAARLAGHQVTGVEINSIIVRDIMLDRYRHYSGAIYQAPGVVVVNEDARAFLDRIEAEFDVIQANAVDTWAATSGGGFTLSESYLYTVEAFQRNFQCLKADGILTVGRWVFNPPQQMLRVVALALEAMQREGIADPDDKIFLLSQYFTPQMENSPGVVFFKKQAFRQDELQTLRRVARERGYKVLFDPHATESNAFAQLIRSRERDAFFDRYPLNVTPTTDNRPFFFFTLKWKDVLSVWNTPVESRKNNSGIFVLLAVLALMLFFASGSFVLPLILKRDAIPVSAAFYFLAIGLAFMMVESVLIQRSILFLGHPTYSFSAVVCALLLGSGFGSWRSRKVARAELAPALGRTLLLAAAALALLAVALTPWLKLAARLPLTARIVWLTLPVIGLGVLLGRLLPLGLQRVSGGAIAWAWALNGLASVLGSIVAVLLAMQAGFSTALWLATALYIVAYAANSRS